MGLNNLNSSSDVISMFKSMRVRWAGHVAHWNDDEMHNILVYAAYITILKPETSEMC